LALLEHKADPNFVTSSDGFSILHHAVENRMHLVVQKLLSLDVNVNMQGRQGNTPLMLAIQQQDTKTIDELLMCDSVELQLQDRQGRTALHFLCAWGHAGLLQRCCKKAIMQTNDCSILDIQNATGQTALHLLFDEFQDAATTLTKPLIGAGASVDIRDLHGTAPHEWQKRAELSHKNIHEQLQQQQQQNDSVAKMRRRKQRDKRGAELDADSVTWLTKFNLSQFVTLFAQQGFSKQNIEDVPDRKLARLGLTIADRQQLCAAIEGLHAERQAAEEAEVQRVADQVRSHQQALSRRRKTYGMYLIVFFIGLYVFFRIIEQYGGRTKKINT
jgi:ankyrin repeat protein